MAASPSTTAESSRDSTRDSSTRDSSLETTSTSTSTSEGMWIEACDAGHDVQVVTLETLGTLAVFRVDDQYYAVDDKCCHGKGRLSDGDVEDLGDLHCQGGRQPDGSRVAGLCVRCPKHHGRFGDRGLYFNLSNGRAFVPVLTEHYKTEFAVRAFEARTSKGKVLVRSVPVLSPSEARESSHESADEAASEPAVTISTTFLLWHLAARPRRINHDSIELDFECNRKRVPEPPDTLGEAWHCTFRARIAGVAAPVDRDYTPVSSLSDYRKGRLRFVIKVYPQGSMTTHLGAMREGDSLLISPATTTLALGPLYTAGLDKDEAKRRAKKGLSLGLIVGGTGVTPALQLLEAAGATRPKFAAVAVIDSNHTEADILCRAQLDAAAAAARATVTHTLTRAAPDGWDGAAGQIDAALLEARMPRPSSRARFVLCGPTGMMQAARAALVSLGHADGCIVELEA